MKKEELLSENELNELASFWDLKQNNSISLNEIYKKSLNEKEIDYLENFFISKINQIDESLIFNQSISIKFLELSLGKFQAFISDFKREFFEFEVRNRGNKFIFFIEKSLLKYLINRLCGGIGRVENKKRLSVFEEDISKGVVSEFLNLLKIDHKIIKRYHKSDSDLSLNVIFNIKFDGFSMLCGISFDEEFFSKDLALIYEDNEFNKELRKKILNIKIPCEISINKTMKLSEISRLRKDLIISVDDNFYLSSQNIKMMSLKGERFEI